ncbi:hypothetical protein JZU46_02830 [bacterium]|nr:hypothetical protein [bacterium]
MAGISKYEKKLRLDLLKQGYKRCSKCGELKNKNDFSLRKDSLSKLVSNCKACLKSYRDSRINIRIEYDKTYLAQNKERKYANNKINNRSLCTNSYFVEKINTKDPKYCTTFKEGFVVVKCYHCNKDYIPIVEEIKNFIKTSSGYCNIYCSDKCKQLCKVYNFRVDLADPDSILYVNNSEKEQARACQTGHLKQLQLDELGYNYCEKCGTEAAIELHHTLEVAKYGLEAISSASHILLCSVCHKELTKQCGGQ